MHSVEYILAIDTNQYAGNFERELCAYATGVLGECEVGRDKAVAFRVEHPDMYDLFVENVRLEPDEHGCFRPVDVLETPGTDNYNTVGIYFYNRPSEDCIEFIKGRAHAWACENNVNITGFRLIEFLQTISESEV